MNELFTLMKSELVLTGIIFLLLFIKIGKGVKNETLLPLAQVLLLANFVFGFVLNTEAVSYTHLDVYKRQLLDRPHHFQTDCFLYVPFIF